MIILRYKYFNEGLVIRWPVPNPSLLLYPKIEKTNRFKKEYELIGKDARKLVDRLEESSMNGYIYEDDPDNSTKEETHCLEDFNEYAGNYPHLVYSKRITGQLRFNYSIYKPKQITKDGRTYYKSRVVLENCWDHKFRDIEYWGTDYPQKDRYNLKNNSVSIKPFKSVKSQWWNDYRAESEKTLPRGTTLDIEFKRSGENEELHTSLFPGTREGRAINLSRVGGKSSELKTFKITRITPNKDSKYNYTIRNSN